MSMLLISYQFPWGLEMDCCMLYTICLRLPHLIWKKKVVIFITLLCYFTEHNLIHWSIYYLDEDEKVVVVN